ncbi:MAG: transcription antitermination factor NusB, partial [Candidatus Zixiibacteriota bacterium]
MTERPSPRRLARELVLQSLYASESGETQPEESFADIVRDHKLSEKNVQFARTLFSLTRQHSDWADQQISKLAEHWDINRIAAIDHTILRMALVELEHVPDTPVKVVLNEAIELARKFSTSESPG